jgi:uncharacterized delta-60 repeat protein
MKTKQACNSMFDVGCSAPKTILHPPPLAAPERGGGGSILVLLLSLGLTAAATLTGQAQSPTADDFNPWAGGSDPYVYSLALQADGKVLLGGSFTALGGQARNCIGRLNSDGTLDTTFNPGAGGGDYPYVYSLAVQADGKILVGGFFTTLGGQPRNCLGRLNSDGTVDPTFNPGANYGVYSLVVQADGKILVGSYNGIGRLNSDGTVDPTFNPEGSDGVFSLAVQADGKILVGGYFTNLGGQPRNYIGRLNSNGTLDTAFNPGADSPYGAQIHSLAVQADGKILVGGYFDTLGGQTRSCIGRLNSNGTVDSTFNPWADGSVHSLAVQADGKILAGGSFSWLSGQTRNGIGRLNSNGTLDTSFNPGTGGSNPYVSSLAVQTDGKVLLGGSFTTLGGQPRNNIGRLNNTGPATQWLYYDGTAITWQRRGTSPEVWRTSFDASTNNGTDWLSLGAGTRVSAGWQLTGLSVPTNANIRARGVVTGGQYNGSTWFVESIFGPLLVVSQPVSRTNNAGTVANFNVLAGGTPPISYQWLRGGVNLSDGGNISGVQTSTLTLSNVLHADEGGYSVIISNGFGSLTSLVATLTVVDPCITSQPVSRNANPGDTVGLSVTAVGTAPLGYQWRKDGADVAGATTASLTLTNVQGADAGGYDVVVSNQFGTVTSAVALLTVNRATTDAFNPGTDGYVYSLAVQADGKILVGGSFTTLGGQTRNCIGRLNSDGTLDTAFNPGTDGYVYSLAVQADGKILVGGGFTTLGGQTRNYLGRLNSDGALDATFNPGAGGGSYPSVRSLAVQADGKILVGGSFTTLSGQPRNYLGRLNSDGTVDTTFNPGAGGSYAYVNSLAVQADGKIVVGGYFTTLGGQPRNYIGRLESDGTLDPTFNPGAGTSVSSLVVQADGKILVGGYFTTLGGQPRNYIGRLESDGTLDPTFNPGAGTSVSSLVVQADGKILVGGYFITLGGQPRNYIGRLESDGTLDPTFNPGAGGEVYCLAVQADGKILVGGYFTTLGGQPRNYIGRLNSTGPATQSLSCDGTAITWLRGGTSPEVWRASFDAFTNNGTDWFSLGAGTRISGGWQLTDISVPTNANFRARGFLTGGQYNGSAWFVESIIGPPLAVSQPVSQYVNAGDSVGFSVTVVGTAPFSYQWRKDGVNLSDGGNISGAQTWTLTLTNVARADEGGYSVVISNLSGSLTSLVATLTVVDPLITSQPVSRNANAGDTVGFSVTAAGTAPLGYQWRRDGAAVAGATAASLTLTNVQGTDAGGYDVVVSNAFGSVTSVVALLTVNEAVPDEFNPGAAGGYASSVNSLAVQPDGKILVGGVFGTPGADRLWRTNIARLNPDGTLDSGFISRADNSVYATVVQTDAKILVGGNFTTLGGQSRSRIGRLNGDGTPDPTFNPGASGTVWSLAVQADGKILVGGTFTTLGGQTCTNVGRLNSDGTPDPTFNPGASGTVWSLAVQADGKILVGGTFTTLGGQPRNYIGRLNSDGTLDLTFNPGASSPVRSFVVQADGKILVGGNFGTLGGQTRSRIGRLNSDGTLDTAFNPGVNGPVYSLAVQADGKIVVGGTFQTLGGQPRYFIGRLNSDGTLDPTFNPAVGGDFITSVYSLAVQADGKTLVGGIFTTLAGQTRYYLGRLNNTRPATQSLSCNGTDITWLRGGTSPELWRTSFNASTNSGTDWFDLGAGTWIGGGWQLTGLSVAANANIRARGFVTGGQYNGSAWFVESIIGPLIVVSQPVSRTNNTDTTATFSVTAAGSAPLSYQWRKGGVNLSNGGNISGVQTPTLTLSNVLVGDAGGYSVILSNAFGSVTSLVATLTVEVNLATVDRGFDPQPADTVYSLAVQTDGKILVGGNFFSMGGETRRRMGRLNADGTLDEGFQPIATGSVLSLVVQGDGKILVGGWFTSLGEQTRYYLGRLNADGTLDNGFDPGATAPIYSLAVQADGKILVAGLFTGLGGQTRYYFGRLNAEGTLDSLFNPGAGGTVYSVAVQADGRILVGGAFTTLGGQPRNCLGRVNADGTLDTTFDPAANDEVRSLAVQADGKILVGGYFTNLGGQTCNRIGRLNADGTLDTSFNPGASSWVYSLGVQADGKILVGGSFTNLAGQTRMHLGRLNPDGTLDSGFNPQANSSVVSLALQADGKILVGGQFTTLGGQARNCLGRINSTEPPTQSLAFDASAITWLRGGTSPEVWRTTFERSTNGIDWFSLGAGTRIVGGWQLAGVALAPGGTLRARGHVTGGHLNASGWFVETTANLSPASILSQPANRTNNVGTDAAFSVAADGTPTLHYQWRKDGTNITGATNSSLTLTMLQKSDRGSYSVAVSNAFGSVTSSDAMLVVNQAPIADASATQPAVISANGVNATVILNGTLSSDPDGDLLQYLWLSTLNSQPSTLLATGVVAVVTLPIGAHPISLVVSDGLATATNAVTVSVLTTSQAVQRLIAQVTSRWPRSRPLVATLEAALASIERGNPVSAINQLQAFQNKVRAQVAPLDPALAASFSQAAQEIIDALSGGDFNPGGRPHGRVATMDRQPNGRVHLQFSAQPGPVHILEASTNLVDWEMIGVAVGHGDGAFEFDDPNAAKLPNRFYRLISP